MLKRILNTTVTRTLKIAFYAGAAVGTLVGTCTGLAIGYGVFRLSHQCEAESDQEDNFSESAQENFVGSRLPEDLEELSGEDFVGTPLKTASQLAGKESAVTQLSMSEEDFVGPPLPKSVNEPISEEKFVGPRLNQSPRQFPTP